MNVFERLEYIKEKISPYYIHLIIFLSLFVRLVRVFTYPDIKKDAVLYFRLGKAWQDGGLALMNKIYEHLPPFYPLALGYVDSHGISMTFFAKSTSILLFVLSVPAFYYIAKNCLKEQRAYLFATLIYAIHPSFVRLSLELLRDSYYIPCFVISMAALFYAENSKKFYSWGLFALLAVPGFMFRKEGVEIVLIFLVWSFVKVVLDKSKFKIVCLQVLFVMSIYIPIGMSMQSSIQKAGYRWGAFPSHIISRQYKKLLIVLGVSENEK
jgi:4-amino-4-deoxy-L-arabinose transferase-like glycosyltransferase